MIVLICFDNRGAKNNEPLLRSIHLSEHRVQSKSEVIGAQGSCCAPNASATHHVAGQRSSSSCEECGATFMGPLADPIPFVQSI